MAAPSSEKEPFRLAYEAGHDVHRYQELLEEHDNPQEVQRLLTEEVAVDFLTHVAELKRTRVFSYFYRISLAGELVENSTAEKPIRDMFLAVDESEFPESSFWLEEMIPGLETMPVGGTAFTLSAKREDQESALNSLGGFEHGYDFGYFFLKIARGKIACYGIELDLTHDERREIVNRQLKQAGRDDLLAAQADFAQIRKRAVFYELGRFDSISKAFVEIVGKVLTETRTSFDLHEIAAVDNFIAVETRKLEASQKLADQLAARLVARIAAGDSVLSVQRIVAQEQERILWEYYPHLVREAWLSGQNHIMLPCGGVSVDFDLRFTAGDSLMEATATRDYSFDKSGTCRICHQHAMLGPCGICESCDSCLRSTS